MNKYLTTKNIAIAVAVVCGIAFFILLFSRPKVKDYSEAMKILKAQNEQLKKQLQDQQREYDAIQLQTQEAIREDSLKIAKYEQRVLSDYYTIQNLKKKRDEKISVIDTAGNNQLRELLSEN